MAKPRSAHCPARPSTFKPEHADFILPRGSQPELVQCAILLKPVVGHRISATGKGGPYQVCSSGWTRLAVTDGNQSSIDSPDEAATTILHVVQGGPAAEGPNYFQLIQDLRMLGALLSKLEGAIASLAASAGNNGYTAKGEFLFELLAKIGLNTDNHFYMERLLDEAADLLSGAAAEQGRRWAPQFLQIDELFLLTFYCSKSVFASQGHAICCLF